MSSSIYVDIFLISLTVNVYMIFLLLLWFRKRLLKKKSDIGLIGLLGLKRMVEKRRKKLI